MTRLNILLTAVLLICAFALINSQHRARKLFNELEHAQQTARRLDIERDQLEIEQTRLSNPAQVRRSATKDLRMQKIEPPNTLYIEQSNKILVQSGDRGIGRP